MKQTIFSTTSHCSCVSFKEGKNPNHHGHPLPDRLSAIIFKKQTVSVSEPLLAYIIFYVRQRGDLSLIKSSPAVRRDYDSLTTIAVRYGMTNKEHHAANIFFSLRSNTI